MKTSRNRTCQTCAERLVDYIKEELPRSHARALEKHLQQCTSCADFARELRRAIEACRAHAGPSMPASTRRRAQQRVRQILAGSRRRG